MRRTIKQPCTHPSFTFYPALNSFICNDCGRHVSKKFARHSEVMWVINPRKTFAGLGMITEA
jgi:hypothetical protein